MIYKLHFYCNRFHNLTFFNCYYLFNFDDANIWQVSEFAKF